MHNYPAIVKNLAIVLTMIITLSTATLMAYTIDGSTVTLTAADRSSDNTILIQGFLNNSSYTKIIIEPGTNNASWMVRPLFFTHNNTEVHLNSNTVLEAKPNGYPGATNCVLRANNLSNIKITGDNGSQIIMQKAEYAEMTASEWRHALNFMSCSNVTVSGLTLSNTGGDGIYLGDLTGSGYCSNISISDVVVDGAGRNGITVISVDGLTITDCTFKNTCGEGNIATAGPWAGIDIEPNHSSECLKNIVIDDCIFSNNAKYGFMLYARELDGSTDELSITVKNSTMYANTQSGIVISRVPASLSNNSEITFQNCTIINNKYIGIRVNSKSRDSGKLSFRDCYLGNNCIADGDSAISVHSSSYTSEVGGNIEFDNVVVKQPSNRFVLYCLKIDGAYYAIDDIIGTLYSSGGTLRTYNASDVNIIPWLAISKSASASSTNSPSHPACHANDSIYSQINPDNYWSCENYNDINSWWSVDLGQASNIDKVRVQYRDINGSFHLVPLSVTVQISNDNSNWATVISKSSNVPGEGDQYNEELYEYPVGGQSARYVRLLFEDGGSTCSGYRLVELTEVEVVSSVSESHWKLDETSGTTANDALGNCNGTLVNSPTWTTGYIGGGLNLNGTNQLVTVADNDSLDMDTGNFSISLWFQRSDNAATNKRLLCKGASSDTDIGYALSGSNTTLSLLLCNGVTRKNVGCSIPSLDEWHHFVCNIDRTNGKASLYMNGIYQSSVDISDYDNDDISNSSELKIGAASNNGWLAWPRKIDDVRVYKRILTSGEIENFASSPSALWHFDEGSGSTTADSIGRSSGALQNSPAWTTGKLGSALALNGSNQLVSVSNNPYDLNIGTADFSISLWFQRSDNAITNKRLLCKGASSDTDIGYALSGSNTTLSLLLCNGVTRKNVGCSIPSLDEWHHFVCTIDRENGEAVIYMNGAYQSSIDISAYTGGDISNSRDLQIGAVDGNGWLAWPGKIDDVQIYKRVLSEYEVIQLYSATP